MDTGQIIMLEMQGKKDVKLGVTSEIEILDSNLASRIVTGAMNRIGEEVRETTATEGKLSLAEQWRQRIKDENNEDIRRMARSYGGVMIAPFVGAVMLEIEELAKEDTTAEELSERGINWLATESRVLNALRVEDPQRFEIKAPGDANSDGQHDDEMRALIAEDQQRMKIREYDKAMESVWRINNTGSTSTDATEVGSIVEPTVKPLTEVQEKNTMLFSERLKDELGLSDAEVSKLTDNGKATGVWVRDPSDIRDFTRSADGSKIEVKTSSGSSVLYI